MKAGLFPAGGLFAFLLMARVGVAGELDVNILKILDPVSDAGTTISQLRINGYDYSFSAASKVNAVVKYVWKAFYPPYNGYLMEIEGGGATGSATVNPVLRLYQLSSGGNVVTTQLSARTNVPTFFNAQNNVGIGTTTPSAMLHVAGRVKIQDVLQLPPRAQPDSATEGDVYYDSTAHTLKLYTGKQWKSVVLR